MTSPIDLIAELFAGEGARDYLGERPSASQTHLLQGGPFTETETRAFERLPHFRAAVAVRRRDEAAKDAALVAPPFEHFRGLLTAVASGT